MYILNVMNVQVIVGWQCSAGALLHFSGPIKDGRYYVQYIGVCVCAVVCVWCVCVWVGVDVCVCVCVWVGGWVGGLVWCGC